MYTLCYTLTQLDRLYSYIDQGQQIRIIHVLLDDTGHWDDHYIVLLDCEPATYTLLLML